MARIAGIDLPRDKRIEIGLTYIYGIGRKSASDILAAAGVNPDTGLVEIVEIPSHPFFIATQFHPEYKSTPEHPQPLFVHFVKACMDKR